MHDGETLLESMASFIPTFSNRSMRQFLTGHHEDQIPALLVSATDSDCSIAEILSRRIDLLTTPDGRSVLAKGNGERS